MSLDGGDTVTDPVLVEALVNRINVELDVPYFSEASEAKAIRWVVDKVVVGLDDEVVQLLHDVSDGISEAEKNRLVSMAVRFINQRVDAPFIPEALEETIIRTVVTAVFDLALKGSALFEE